jgi:pimeloyl-ACP methyl ester carboxylesterase
MQITDRTIRADGVELATQAFGDPSDRPMLLIMGLMASMLWWPEELCERLAAAGHYVIRYDNRDTGLSTTYPPGRPGYDARDMVEDAIRILDAYGIGKAHIAGMSMGGMIAQKVALNHPERVSALTVLSTSPIGIGGLPGMTDAYKAHAAEGEHVDWSNPDEAIAYVAKDAGMLAGPTMPFDAKEAHAFVLRDVSRGTNLASATNHFQLVAGGEELDIRDLQMPLLVLHGTADPLFPIEHAQAFAKAVKGTRAVTLEGGGHELNPVHWDRIVSSIAAHTTETNRA